MPAPNPETLLTRLHEQGDRRAAAKVEAQLAMAEIAKLARKAHKAGAQKAAIARAARISRPALDVILND